MLASLLSFIALAVLIAAMVWYFKISKPPGRPAAGGAKQSPKVKWSGRVDGDLPIKRLTGLQANCLSDAVFGDLIIRDSDISDRRLYERDEAQVLHKDRTVDSLVKHGFLVADGKGAYICTDLGARAHETLPVQW
jgi:hypothetical protein